MINAYIVHAIRRWDLSRLTTLILDSPDIGSGMLNDIASALLPLWEIWGHQLVCTHFGSHLPSSLKGDLGQSSIGQAHAVLDRRLCW